MNSITNNQLKIAYNNNNTNLEDFLNSIDTATIINKHLRDACRSTIQSITITRELLEEISEQEEKILA